MMTAFVDTAQSRRPWRESVVAGLFAWVISVFMAAPPFSSWSWFNIEHGRAGDFLRLCANPFARDLNEPMLAYRIATPLLAWLLHLGPEGSLSLAYFFSLATLIALHRVARQIVPPAGAFALATAIACSSTIRFPNWILGVPDSLTHFCAVCALGLPAGGCTLAVMIGWMNDERMALALPFIILWRWDRYIPGKVSRTTRSGNAVWPVLAGTLLAATLRLALARGWIGPGISSPTLYVQIVRQIAAGRPWLESWGVWLANWALGPGWLWLIIAAPWVFAGTRPSPSLAAMHAGAFLGAGLLSFVVSDAARTPGFGFIAAIQAAAWMARVNPRRAERWLLAVCMLQVVTPAIWLYEDWQWLQYRPLLWELKLFLAV